MLFNRSEIDEVQQRTNRCVNGIIHLAALLIGQLNGLDERRRGARVLLKEHRRLNSTRIPLENRGPVFQKRHDLRTDFQIVGE